MEQNLAAEYAEIIENIIRKNSIPEIIECRAKRKLILLFSAENYNDLCQINGNHCKKLYGKQEGLNSIRIDGKWRILFYWNKEKNTVDKSTIRIINNH